jgi:transcriptional regulator with PAS, ATPase and Fis domain
MLCLSNHRASSFLAKPIIGKSQAIHEIRHFIKKAAQTDHTVLLIGETGVGKEIVARNIHMLSKRKNTPFMPLNCANIPENLAESELFGYAKGAFTDAKLNKEGLFEQAFGGTVFLDEISKSSLYIQAKFLRVIEDREVRRLGNLQARMLNVRFIIASNKDLNKEVRKGKFRKDLYYRINVLKLEIPPLRKRKEDILMFIEYILGEENKKNNSNKHISKEALTILLRHNYPGNVRELENIIRRAYIFAPDKEIRKDDIILEYQEEEEDNARKLFNEMAVKGKSFWEVVHEPFLEREISRADAKKVICLGLSETKGNYKKLLELFNLLPTKSALTQWS